MLERLAKHQLTLSAVQVDVLVPLDFVVFLQHVKRQVPDKKKQLLAVGLRGASEGPLGLE